MTCFYHPSAKEVYICDRCNRPICSDCIISFKNQKKFRTVDDDQRGFSYLDPYSDPYADERSLEDLKWCLPCYYSHFNADLVKKEALSTKTLSIIIELIAYSVVIAVLYLLVNFEFKISFDMQQLLSPGIFIPLVIVYGVAFILLYQYREKEVREKRTKLDMVKERFMTITTVGTIDLPIECYFCKVELDTSSLACMNIECTLGENVDKDAKIVNIDPVNTNYGFANTLKPLPRFPPEEEKKN